MYAPLIAVAAATVSAQEIDRPQVLRPPAVPLVTHDPYFSIWSAADRLYDRWPSHWTGATQALHSVIRVDGRPYRLMGGTRSTPGAMQTALRVLPTRTIYVFEIAGVEVTLTFTSPILPDDLDVYSRPVTYLSWSVRSIDGAAHKAELLHDGTGEAVVDRPHQEITWSRPEIEGLAAMRMGSSEQPVLEKDGDDLRIDWGYLYAAAPVEDSLTTAIGPADPLRNEFARTGSLPEADDERKPRPVQDQWPSVACAWDLGEVGAEPVSRWMLLAYDDEHSIQYLGENLRPWWRRTGLDGEGLVALAVRERESLVERCEAFDAALVADAEAAGGREYADLCSLAYRQAMAAHKLVAADDGTPMLFSKENFSNGCIATVDVAYPASPIFALLSSDLLKALIEPVLRYAATDRWQFPYAPHDVGRYPKANGQVYGGGETSEDRQMPVEESGNMLIMLAVIAHIDGDADYAGKYWPLIEQWADYLKSKGLDPENQLCTDDFAGHLAHNANLSLKAIVALACYARLCEARGLDEQAGEYRETAESYVGEWIELADDGDHYRLAFDKPGTWSQKYNLVWDVILGLDLFPPEGVSTEVAFYKTQLNPYGLPLDSRSLYTKTDWEVWTATLAETRGDFDALMTPVYAFVDETPQRVPMTDWYWTQNAEYRAMQARPVIGGVFIKLLRDADVWSRWASR